MIAYQTAYLKAYYPVEFYASLIRSVEEDTDELSNYISETQNQGLQVLPPNINQSFNHVAAIQDAIRLWFFCIKGLGFEIGETIQEERKKNGLFKDLEDFVKRCSAIVNKKSLEWLIKSGWLDDFGERGSLLTNIETILERSKKSKEMGGWLFDNIEFSNKITLKSTHPATMMERLMMEQQAFKSFVSWHPLDGLYLYLKRYNFISQFKEKDGFGSFIIVGYIKNIQRAKKKWFFIQIEDISWTIEFFVKETLDFKKFDIIMVTGFKGKSISVEKIIKTTIDQLKQQAGSKYDPEMTVIKAKSLRLKTNVTEGEATAVLKAEQKKELPLDIAESHTTFKLPDNTSKLNELVGIITNNVGNQEITIGSKTFFLSETGIQKIKDLLS